MHGIKEAFISLRKSLQTKDSFVQNYAYVASGKIAVFIISFFTVPILARLFSPEAYGHFAIYNSISVIVSTNLLMGYPNAYLLIKSNKDFLSLAVFQLAKVFIVSLLICVVILSVGYFYPSLSTIYYFIPVGVLIHGFVIVFSSWNVREGRFNLGSKLEGIGGIGIRLCNLLIGWLGNGFVYGIISGEIIVKSITIGINARVLLKTSFLKLNKQRIKKVLWEWRKYPRFILPNNLLTLFGSQIPIYILALAFEEKALGYYSMSYTVFSVPVQLLANALAPVYLRKATVLYAHGIEALKEFTTKLISVVNLSIFIPFLAVVVFSEEMVHLFLGDQWGPSGFVVALVTFPIFVEITLGPVTSVLQILKKEKMMLVLGITNVGIMALASGFILLTEVEFRQAIVILVGSRLVFGLIKAGLIYQLLNVSVWRYCISYLLLLAVSSMGIIGLMQWL